MKVLYDLHTHTYFSHGKGTPRDNIEAAIAKGLKKIAITDHAPGHRSYGVKRVKEYFQDIDLLRKEYSDRIKVLAGFEFNILNTNADTDYLDDYKNNIDISLVGYHKFAFEASAKAISFFAFNTKKDIVKNTDIYVKLAYSKKYDIITHPGYCLKVDLKELSKACAETDTLIEINNKHNSLLSSELESAVAYGAKFIVSSDAHAPSSVGCVETALKVVKEANVSNAVINLV